MLDACLTEREAYLIAEDIIREAEKTESLSSFIESYLRSEKSKWAHTLLAVMVDCDFEVSESLAKTIIKFIHNEDKWTSEIAAIALYFGGKESCIMLEKELKNINKDRRERIVSVIDFVA